MPVPDPIGPVHYGLPRAVKVRESGDLKATHSAIYSGLNIYVETQRQTEALLAAWPVLMQAVADKANEIIAAVTEEEVSAGNG